MGTRAAAILLRARRGVNQEADVRRATPDQPLGSGNAAVPVGGGSLTNLSRNKTYHFHATATAAAGTIAGGDAT
jgi:hypothetical protein